MVIVRRASERGRSQLDWLDSRHTFSFADYVDARHMGFGPLRVINEDRVAPGRGFGRHPHRDMEILSYVLEGALQHADSMGTGSVIRPGDVQRMSAGTGVVHSEQNHSPSEPVHFLQIWIEPEKRGLPPSYEQKSFPEKDKRGKLRLIASRNASDGSVKINQDAQLYVTLLKPGEEVTHDFSAGRHGWLQVARGAVELNGKKLGQGDGAAISDEKKLTIKGTEDAEVLLFDLG